METLDYDGDTTVMEAVVPRRIGNRLEPFMERPAADTEETRDVSDGE